VPKVDLLRMTDNGTLMLLTTFLKDRDTACTKSFYEIGSRQKGAALNCEARAIVAMDLVLSPWST
jgi:hypothetical protein